MENAGCVTFLEDYIFRSRVTDFAREARGETILHEMAHMWFGDLVTMRWWDDLWLNESFATWAGTLAAVRGDPVDVSLDHVRAAVQVLGLPAGPAAVHPPDRGRHPGHRTPSRSTSTGSPTPRARRCSSSWSPTSGGRTSWPGCGSTSARTRGATRRWPTCSPRWSRPRAGTWPSWSRDWLQTAGVNTLRPAYAVDADGRFTEFAVEQEAAPRPIRCCARTGSRSACTTGPQAGLSRRLPGRDRRGRAAHRDRRSWPGSRARTWCWSTTTTSATPRSGWTSIRCARWSTPRSASFTDSLPAALCWAAAWDMCRDGEMAARDYVRLVLSGVASVSDISVVQTLLRQAGHGGAPVRRPGWRETGLALMASALRGLLARREPGSDAQLAYLRAFAGVASLRRGPGAAGRAAGRLGAARRAQRRHRPALGAAGAAGQPGRAAPGRRRHLRAGRDRRGAGPGRDRRGRAARRDLPGGDPHAARPSGRPGGRSPAAS